MEYGYLKIIIPLWQGLNGCWAMHIAATTFPVGEGIYWWLIHTTAFFNFLFYLKK